MDFDEIKKLSYSQLISKLPEIVSSFSTSMYISKGRAHRWNRMHNRKIMKTVSIPGEIEKYIVNEIKNLDKYIESKINIALLVRNCWYISYYPFESAIMELIDEYIVKFSDKIDKKIIIFIDNLRRNKNRSFDTFYAGDLAWLLGVYFNSLIKGSRLITYRNKNMESNFPQSDIFPFHNYIKEVHEIDDIDIYKEIANNYGSDCVIFITKIIGNHYEYYDRLDSKVNKTSNEKEPVVIIWELLPCYKITPEKYTIKYLQGFTENNFMEIEDIINKI
jgi:hypothetical protein